MPIGIYEKNDIDAIAKSIRNNLDNDTKYTTEQMPTAIDEIQAYAYNSGHSDGWSDGWISGNNEGLEQGRTEGLEEGKAIGYAEGKTDGLAEGIEQGKKSQYDEFWDEYQVNGNRTDYQYAFGNTRWNDATFKPKYDIRPSGYGCTNMFWSCSITNLEERLQERGITLDTSKAHYFAAMYQNADSEIIPELDIRIATSLAMMFLNADARIIRKLIVAESTPFINNTFQGCANLEEIRFEGEIGKSVNLSYCVVLSIESMKSALTHLKDYSGTSSANTYTVQFPEARWSALEADSLSPNGTSWRKYTEDKGWLY